MRLNSSFGSELIELCLNKMENWLSVGNEPCETTLPNGLLTLDREGAVATRPNGFFAVPAAATFPAVAVRMRGLACVYSALGPKSAPLFISWISTEMWVRPCRL